MNKAFQCWKERCLESRETLEDRQVTALLGDNMELTSAKTFAVVAQLAAEGCAARQGLGDNLDLRLRGGLRQLLPEARGDGITVCVLTAGKAPCVREDSKRLTPTSPLTSSSGQ